MPYSNLLEEREFWLYDSKIPNFWAQHTRDSLVSLISQYSFIFLTGSFPACPLLLSPVLVSPPFRFSPRPSTSLLSPCTSFPLPSLFSQVWHYWRLLLSMLGNHSQNYSIKASSSQVFIIVSCKLSVEFCLRNKRLTKISCRPHAWLCFGLSLFTLT